MSPNKKKKDSRLSKNNLNALSDQKSKQNEQSVGIKPKKYTYIIYPKSMKVTPYVDLLD